MASQIRDGEWYPQLHKKAWQEASAVLVCCEHPGPELAGERERLEMVAAFGGAPLSL